MRSGDPFRVRRYGAALGSAILASIVGGSDEFIIHLTKEYRGTKGIEPVSIAVVCFLFLGFLGYMWFKNLPTG